MYYTTGNLSDIDDNVNSEADGPFKWMYYTTGNLSDIDDNVNSEADGPFKWIYLIIGTDFCCIRVFIIIGLSKRKRKSV